MMMVYKSTPNKTNNNFHAMPYQNIIHYEWSVIVFDITGNNGTDVQPVNGMLIGGVIGGVVAALLLLCLIIAIVIACVKCCTCCPCVKLKHTDVGETLINNFYNNIYLTRLFYVNCMSWVSVA